MRDVREYVDDLQRIIQKGRQLRYEHSGHQHEVFQKWWHDLLFLIEELDKQYHRAFLERFDEAYFIPSKELKQQIDVSGYTSREDIEIYWEHESSCHKNARLLTSRWLSSRA
jgi:hypothetical protein